MLMCLLIPLMFSYHDLPQLLCLVGGLRLGNGNDGDAAAPVTFLTLADFTRDVIAQIFLLQDSLRK